MDKEIRIRRQSYVGCQSIEVVLLIHGSLADQVATVIIREVDDLLNRLRVGQSTVEIINPNNNLIGS